jgi:hypothetical protein
LKHVSYFEIENFFSNPVLSFDSSDCAASSDTSNWREQINPVELLLCIDKLIMILMKIKEAWSKPFIDIDSGFCLITEDLKVMDPNIHNLRTHL